MDARAVPRAAWLTETFPLMTVNGKDKETRMAEDTVALSIRSTTPITQNGKVPPIRRKNADIRSREYLTSDEVDRLSAAAKSIGRHGHRDMTMIIMMFRHGLRVSELIAPRWDMIDLKQGIMHVSRLKNGMPSVHPLRGPEIRALRKLQRDYPSSPYVFVTERRGPLTSATVRKLVARAGDKASLPFPVHPHMLRHSTGFKLANDGQDTRGDSLENPYLNVEQTNSEFGPNVFWKGMGRQELPDFIFDVSSLTTCKPFASIAKQPRDNLFIGI